MARILLKDKVSFKQVGQAILALAALQDMLRKSIRRENDFNAEELAEFLDVVSTKIEQMYFASDDMHTELKLDDDEKIFFRYHVDGANTKGDYIVNVAVPDIGDKRVDLNLVFELLNISTHDQKSIAAQVQSYADATKGGGEVYDFNGFAEETLGFIVIFGCGR